MRFTCAPNDYLECCEFGDLTAPSVWLVIGTSLSSFYELRIKFVVWTSLEGYPLVLVSLLWSLDSGSTWMLKFRSLVDFIIVFWSLASPSMIVFCEKLSTWIFTLSYWRSLPLKVVFPIRKPLPLWGLGLPENFSLRLIGEAASSRLSSGTMSVWLILCRSCTEWIPPSTTASEVGSWKPPTWWLLV